MFLGYNTNGFAHHRLGDALDVLAELGYGGVALTPDVNHLDPHALDLSARTAEFGAGLARHGLRCAIETGARFVLDPRRKHQPTLISPTDELRERRHWFLWLCVRLAEELGAGCVSFWSGAPDDRAAPSELMTRLVEQCKRLAEEAGRRGVRLAFEPEPGMFIDTMDKFAELHGRVNHPAFGLTVDVGHLVCNGELPVSKFLADWKHVLWNIHIEDMRPGVHDHIMFGEGAVDFADVFAGLRAAGYREGVYVELSRHSYDAVSTARKARAFLTPYLGERGT
ncbi:L-ribulose-5-phosphate 3-epimerase UlaE [Gemmata obscuriglobus]|uniref:Sugar phosphate isomerase/epimerase n=1 Tax=Gemmata obscuriglobus TaxID=114 RepID=A0A2Z3H9F0_9BACT|nr:sugar phosphate isomerase/epimerase family protein [Gemmata obscuriglobus]AWM41521.1 sugar phosphate isomerase/epimerase [Gemmata obscuriglobus]QEG32570.1 L-ribulose-5-phosphate 3-epimerase UlaE [Gemmata obscuriglobus]VTS11926.1 Putaive isomerase OS=Planctomyces maris DSM 8797 GN=PM8797T_12673 PE=4 SV=1: AP_endonuc_2 [Gemmata obscuriglobus UQM 2246]